MNKTIYIILLALLTLPEFVNSQVPTGHICPLSSGKPLISQGSGACSGNNLVKIDLSYVYPGLRLYLNSTYNYDHLDIGNNVTISEISILDLSPNSSYYMTGDGTRYPLEYRSTGVFAGSYVAKDRNTLRDSFKAVNNTEVVQTSVQGVQSKLTKAYGNIYTLSEIKNKVATSSFSLGANKKEEFIIIGTDRINISRSGLNITLTNDKEKERYVTLVRDNLRNLVRIVYPDETKYELSYFAKGLIASLKLSNKTASEETRYIYDDSNRLYSIVFPNKTSVRTTRSFDEVRKLGVVKTAFPSGEILEEHFNQLGHIIKRLAYLNENINRPYENISYSWDTAGKLLSTSYSADNKSIKTNLLYLPQDPRLLNGYEILENNVSVEKFVRNIAVTTLLSSLDTLYGENNKVIAQTGYQYNNENHLQKVTYIKGDPRIEGSRDEISRDNANSLIITSYNKANIKTSSSIYNDQYIEEYNFLAPPSIQKTRLDFNQLGLVSSLEHAGKKIGEFKYDSEGREVYRKDASGLEYLTSYDEKSYVQRMEIIAPAGKTIHEYSRNFGGDKKDTLLKLVRTTTYPSGKVDVLDERYSEEGEVLEVYFNGVLVEG